MSGDRRLWSNEVKLNSQRKISKLFALFRDMEQRNGQSYLKNYALRHSTSALANNAGKGSPLSNKVVQSS